MTKTSIKAGGAAVLAVVLAALFVASPASAAVVPSTSSVTTFTASAASPAFTVTTNSGLNTGAPYQILNIDVKASSNFTYWALGSGCTTTSGPLSSCKISSISVNGSPVTGATVKTLAMQTSDLEVTFASPIASGSVISVAFDAGAFTTGPAGSWVVRFMTYSNQWTSADDSPEAPVTTTAGVVAPSSNNSGQVSSAPAAEASLANTGIDSVNGSLFLIGGLSLALVGAEMLMIARRKRNN